MNLSSRNETTKTPPKTGMENSAKFSLRADLWALGAGWAIGKATALLMIRGRAANLHHRLEGGFRLTIPIEEQRITRSPPNREMTQPGTAIADAPERDSRHGLPVLEEQVEQFLHSKVSAAGHPDEAENGFSR